MFPTHKCDVTCHEEVLIDPRLGRTLFEVKFGRLMIPRKLGTISGMDSQSLGPKEWNTKLIQALKFKP